MDNNGMNAGRRMRGKIFAWALSAALVFTLAPSSIFADTDAPESEASPSAIEGGAPESESSPAAVEGDAPESVGSSSAIEAGAPESGSSPAAVEGAPVAAEPPADANSPGGEDSGVNEEPYERSGVHTEIVSASALYPGAAEDETKPEDTLGPVLEKGSDYTLFRGDNGDKIVKWYASDVRHEDEEGRLTDYDNSVVPAEGEDLSDYPFTNAEGDALLKLPAEPGEETPIVIESKAASGRPFRMYPVRRGAAPSEDSGDAPSVTLAAISEEDLCGKITNRISAVVYPGEEEGVAYEYSPLRSGVKETIILYEKPASSDFLFRLELENSRPETAEDGSVLFLDATTGELLGTIAPPTVRDAKGVSGQEADGTEYESPYYMIEEEESEGSYLLTLRTDPGYLSVRTGFIPS